jgi:hypothetical protein
MDIEISSTQGETLKMEIALAGLAFAGLFAMWVILPGKIRKDRSK